MMEPIQPEWGLKLSRIIPIPQRFIMAVMCFLSLLNAYAMRISLSIAITRLVPPPETNVTFDSTICPPDDDIEEEYEIHKPAGIYDWSQEEQGVILGAFYIGYIIGHLPAGILAVYCNAKWVLCLGLLSTAVLTLITPMVIRATGDGSAIGLIALRVFMGCFGGCSFPALSALVAQWVPPNERGFLGSLIMGGGQLGIIVSNSIAGLILHYTTWPWVFYTFGTCCCVWCFFFSFMCFSDIDSHPYIKPTERAYLRANLSHRRRNVGPIPWRAMLTSCPVICYILAYMAHEWGFYVVVTDMPKYMNDVMRFSIHKNGFFSSLPFVAMWACSIFYGYLADLMFSNESVSLTEVRKFWTFFAAAPCGFFLAITTYAGCNRILVVFFFIVAMALCGGFYAGVKLSPNDLTPNYAPCVIAIGSDMGAIMGFLAPWTTGLLTKHSTLEEWRLVFWLACIILMVLTVPFMVFGTAEVQEWNDPDK